MTFMVHVEASPSARTAGADSYTYRSGNHPGKYGPLTILMSWKHWIEDHPRAENQDLARNQVGQFSEKQGMLVTFLKCFQYSTFAFQTALQDEWAANHLRHIGPTEMSDWRFDLSQAFKLPTGAFWLLLTCFKRPKKFWVYFPYLRPLLSRTEIGSATELLAARCSDWVGQWISMNQWMWLAPLKPCTAKAVAIWMSCTRFATVELLKKKRIRSRETIKGDHVFKFPLFEEIHFDSFQNHGFPLQGRLMNHGDIFLNSVVQFGKDGIWTTVEGL